MHNPTHACEGRGTYTPPRIILSSTVEAEKEKMKSSEKESERERENRKHESQNRSGKSEKYDTLGQKSLTL
jgi:hypothetical protein